VLRGKFYFEFIVLDSQHTGNRDAVKNTK
jgi:hypothetical protein